MPLAYLYPPVALDSGFDCCERDCTGCQMTLAGAYKLTRPRVHNSMADSSDQQPSRTLARGAAILGAIFFAIAFLPWQRVPIESAASERNLHPSIATALVHKPMNVDLLGFLSPLSPLPSRERRRG